MIINDDDFAETAVPAKAVEMRTADKQLSYLQQENSVLHERVRKLEIALEAEREACAKVAEEIAKQANKDRQNLRIGSELEVTELSVELASNRIAALIRGRE